VLTVLFEITEVAMF